MADNSVTPASALRPTSSPPLRVHHFFLLMTCMALVASWRLSLNAKFDAAPSRYIPKSTPAEQYRYALLQTICHGSALAVVIASATWTLRHRTGAWRPGAWLAALGAAELLETMEGTLPWFVSWFGPPETGPSFTIHFWRDTTFYFVCALFIGFTAIKSKGSWIWRIALGILSVQLVVYALFNGIFIAARIFHWSDHVVDDFFTNWLDVSHFSRKAAVIAITVAAGVNLIRRPMESWTHWVGVASWLAMAWYSELVRYFAL